MNRTSFVVLLFVLVAVSLSTAARAATLYTTNATQGSFTTVLVYAINYTDTFVHVLTTVSGGQTYFWVVGVQSGAYEWNAVGSSARVVPVVVNPAGCRGTVNTNCAANDVAAVERERLLRRLWSLPPDSDECVNAGGDALTCLGVPFVVVRGSEYVAPSSLTQYDLLNAQGVAIRTGMGANCAAPSLVWVNVEMPRVAVSTDCVSDTSGSFDGEYVKYELDPYPDAFTMDYVVFKRLQRLEQQRWLLRRVAADSLQFRIVLAEAVGVDSFLPLFVSQDVLGSGEVVWTDELRWDVPYVFTNNTNGTCNATFSVVPAPIPLQLGPIVSPNDVDYALNLDPPAYYRTRPCNYHVGRFDFSGRLVYPYLGEGQVGGGRVVARSPGVPGVLLNVDPDPRYASYVEDCSLFYPKCEVFQGFGINANDGAFYDRAQPAQTLCYAPFLNPELIADTQDLNARFKDCFAQGGWAVGSPPAACARVSDVTKCELGWVFYDQYCHRVFVPSVDKYRYQVPQSAATATCESLGASTWIGDLGPTDLAFLRDRLVLQKRESPGFPYRVAQGSGCVCADYARGTNSSCEDTGFTYACNCENFAFPVCRYHWSERPPHDVFVDMHPATRALFRDGQRGAPFRGRSYPCECEPGWNSPDCAAKTCVPPTEIAASVAQSANNPLVSYFFKCYANQRGYCWQGQVRACRCGQFFAPPSEFMGPFANVSCACPASASPIDGAVTFRINDVQHVRPELTRIPCGGVNRGFCFVESATNLGVCRCVDRVNLDPDSILSVEPAYNGAACTCRKALLPPPGQQIGVTISTGYASGHGTCCPSGERQDEEIVDGAAKPLYVRNECFAPDGSTINGNVCDNGYAGEACTCPEPFDVAAKSVVGVFAFTSYVDLGVRTRVVVAIVGPNLVLRTLETPACTIQNVATADSLVATRTPCVFDATPTFGPPRWLCAPPDAFAQFVVVTTLELEPTCEIAVFSDFFPPCGHHGLPYAGAFFSNPTYRGIQKYEEPQPIVYAPYGCTNTACMCEPNYTGENCAYGVSGVRPSTNGTVRMVCGESTLPARGAVGDDACECASITVTDRFGIAGQVRGLFFGDACECAATYVKTLGRREPCAAHGTCVRVRMPLGQCDYDLADLAADPLSAPFTGVFGVPFVVPTYRFEARDNSSWDLGLGDRRSVLQIDGFSWLVAVGQVFNVSSLTYGVNSCANTVKLPVNITYTCAADGGTQAPERAIAQIEVWVLDTLCPPGDETPSCFFTTKTTQTCDPARYAPPFLCDTQTYCLESWVLENQIDPTFGFVSTDLEKSKCIGRQIWEPLGDDEILVSAEYRDVWIMCANATALNPQANDVGAVGNLDCSNPVDRNIDHGATLAGLQPQDQCARFPIGPYSWTLGQFFGLFTNGIPDLSFTVPEWTDAQYAAVASVVNDERCFDSLNRSVEAWTSVLADDYVVTWLGQGALPETSFSTNGSVFDFIVLDDPLLRPNNYDFNGLYGNNYSHVVYMNSLVFGNTSAALAAFTFANRPGLSVQIPLPPGNTAHLRKISVRFPLDVLEFQLVGSTGRVCATVQRLVRANETLVFNCLDAFAPEPLPLGLDRIFYDPAIVYPNRIELALLYLNSTTPNTLLYVPAGYFSPNDSLSTWPRFNASDFSLVGRDESYVDLFAALRRSILVEHRFPDNAPLRAAYAAMGAACRPIDLSDPDDLTYLRNFYFAFLANRRCAADWQCTLTTPTDARARCIFDSDSYVPWRNGDLETYPNDVVGPVGDEGGCECAHDFSDQGFYSPPHFCAQCVDGYGPLDEVQWAETIAYQNSILAAYPSLATSGDWPIYDPNEQPWSAILSINTPEIFNASLYCRWPSSVATSRATVMAGGRGRLFNSSRVVEYNATVWLDRFGARQIAACTSVLIDADLELDLLPSTNPNLLTYESTNATLNVVAGSVYTGEGAPWVLISCVPPTLGRGFACVYLDETADTKIVECVNPALYSNYSVVVSPATIDSTRIPPSWLRTIV
jgi:hypothetical protein